MPKKVFSPGATPEASAAAEAALMLDRLLVAADLCSCGSPLTCRDPQTQVRLTAQRIINGD